MATIESFYQWLIGLFKEGEHLEYDDIKYRMEEAGYGDVKAEDVYNAVNTMIEEGDVFTNEQTSMLEAYTGGNYVEQGAYAPSGAASGGSAAGGSSVSGGYSSTPSAPASAPAYVPPPPPPPLDSDHYGSDLEAAISQITYVNNVTNNTYTEDNDYFSDDDTVIDSSVNQNIVAAGDVHQDFDTVTATGQSVAAGEDIEDSAVIAGDVEDSVVSGDDTYLEGSAVGDNNTILNDSDGAVTGDGSTAIYGSSVEDSAVASGGGDATNDSQVAGDYGVNAGENANTGGGDLIDAEHSVVGTGGDTVGNTGDLVNSNQQLGDGTQEGIAGSTVEAAEFGEGDLEITENNINADTGAAVTTGDYSASEGEFEENFDEQFVEIENSELAGVGIADDGPAEGEFEAEIKVDEIDVEPEHHDDMSDVVDA